jgi:glycosyltransferase involved in cell wall biosynthesis
LGDGRFREHLGTIAGPETTFLGAASDEVLQDLYRRCRALLMPGVEDFGIVPVEAMACGTPVLALGEGALSTPYCRASPVNTYSRAPMTTSSTTWPR